MTVFIRLIKLLFLITYQVLFYCLDKLIPSVKKKVSFYVTDKTFGDNLFYFHEYLTKNDKLTTELIFQDKSLFNQLQHQYPNTSYIRTIKGFFNYFRSEVVIIQNGDAKLFFFPLLINPKTKFVLNLWHGIPLKKLNRQVKHYQQNRFDFQYQQYSAFTVCSEFEESLIKRCFSKDIDNIWITGTPRNDEMLSLRKNNSLKEYHGKKVVLYAPTWREYGNTTSFFPFDNFNETELIDFLETNKLYLFLRGHRLEMSLLEDKYSTLIQKSKFIVLADQKTFPNIPDLLHISQGLITDYSSIYLDYLLLNRPIMFTPYDFDEYKSYRGFLFDYDTHTPGAKVFTQKEFLSELKKTTCDTHQNETKRLKEQKTMHQYVDTNAKQRIYDKLCTSLNW